MNKGKFVFSLIMELISYKRFPIVVNRHSGDYKVRDFTCWKQFLCMAFGQLTHRESISDTVMRLKGNAPKTYHLGIGEVVSLSTTYQDKLSIYDNIAISSFFKAQ